MSKHQKQGALRRNSSLKHTIGTYHTPNENPVVEHSNPQQSSMERPLLQVENNDESNTKDKEGGRKDLEDYTSDKEEVNISGCRRRIQNRPNKKNSKSKSFCEQRKFRSHSPLPTRLPKQDDDDSKLKVNHCTHLIYEFDTKNN